MAMSASSPIQYIHGTFAGVPIHHVMVNPASNSLLVTVCLAKGGVGHGEKFDSMVERIRPLAAISGDFYDTKTYKPVGDIVIDGKVVYDGCIGPALIIPKGSKTLRIISQEEYKKTPKSTLQLGMQLGPTLIRDGKELINPEGFKHIAKTASRTAIGITEHGKLVLVATDVPICLGKMEDVMEKLDCTDAAILDGGSSTGIYADGRVMLRPARPMTSLLVVLDKNQ
jgi:exopolysaccharide biosynthesis protein